MTIAMSRTPRAICHSPWSAVRFVSRTMARPPWPWAQEFRPDVCLIDRIMPGMDGQELAHRLREQAQGRTPYAALPWTGCWDIDSHHQTHNSEFEEHLVKPVDPQHLVEVVLGRRLAGIA